MGRKFSGKCLFGSLWRSSSSAQPGSYAASSSRSGFFLERSFSETNRTFTSASCSCKHQRNIFFPEFALTAKINLHLESKESKTHEATNLLSSLELRAACLRELQVAPHLPDTFQKYQKSEKNLKKEAHISASSRMRPTWVMASSSANTASSSSGDKDPASISSICCTQNQVWKQI